MTKEIKVGVDLIKEVAKECCNVADSNAGEPCGRPQGGPLCALHMLLAKEADDD